MLFLSDVAAKIEQAVTQYQSCKPAEQAILRVLSIVNKRIGQVKFKKILSELSHSDAFYQQKLQIAFTPEFREMAGDKGLLDVTKDGVRISPFIEDHLTRLSIGDNSFEQIIDHSENVMPITQFDYWREPVLQDRQRQVRDAFYRGQFDVCIEVLLIEVNPQQFDGTMNKVLLGLCFYPYRQDEFLDLPIVIQYQAFATLLRQLRQQLVANGEIINALDEVVKYHQQRNIDCENLRLLLIEHYLLAANIPAARDLLGDETSTYGLQLVGWMQFLSGFPELAVESYQQAIVAKNRIARRKKQTIGDLPGLFHILALLQLGSDKDPSQLPIALKHLDYVLDDYRMENPYRVSYMLLKRITQVLSGKLQSFMMSEHPFQDQGRYSSMIEVIVACLCSCWSNEHANEGYLSLLQKALGTLDTMQDTFFAHLSANLLQRFDKSTEHGAVIASQPHEQLIDVCQLIARKEAWALALEQLIALDSNAVAPATSTENKESRLVWLFEPDSYDCFFEAKEQKLGKNGWSKGRAISLKRLQQEYASFDFLTEGDIKMCHQITSTHSGGYYGRDVYELGGFKALKAAVNLPNLYLLKQPDMSVELLESEPELLITQHNNDFLLSMANVPTNFEDGAVNYSVTKENSQRYRLVCYENKHLKIAGIVGEGGLVVPASAKDKVMQSINAIAPMLNIQSNISGIDTGVEQVVSDSKLYINILPAGDGLEFECHVQPMGALGPSLPPGHGNPTFSTEIEGKRLGTTRDLVQELDLLRAIAIACPTFEYLIDNKLLCDRLDDALTTLEQLEFFNSEHYEEIPCTDNLSVVLLWPKGIKFKLSKQLGMGHMQLAMTKQKEWFSLEGQLEISEDRVIELKELLNLISRSNSRFVRLDDDEILTLTDELRQRLQALDQVSELGKFHLLASPVVEEATQGMRLKTLHAWQEQKELLAEAQDLVPVVPSTLQAELRDYQIEGFEWATKLAHWGGGACLADDMGLGKTLQALAVIVDRACDGPTLILAPTSVCFNWQQEAARFAPTLRVKIFGVDTSTLDQRQLMLDGATAFDVIICSYGLLQREGERLAKVTWQTIVADEAQALKNPTTKRTQAAMSLSGKFKMITTGTPIENNLTELWSLFRFINPGLLGSQKQFHKRYANIIESNKEGDEVSLHRASASLRQIISPFMLRRMKNQVLTELPPRTEINIQVELSEQEKALYEAMRQQAIENMAKGNNDSPGQHHIKMLAEIMRLRRVCCHPSLVAPEANIEGSKLKAFDGLIDELMLNNHKALVFSQFVGHLEILRHHLDLKGISYQYLDGSTPAKKRRDAVNAFQAGHGDVFLISLKAGGSGLNLTAADYVIHMDPWWNPAVEDQASDRAHRMGQTRPVTIYRLIAKNTIEDKILALHQQKRDLANSLLAESSSAATGMTVNDMMALLQTPI